VYVTLAGNLSDRDSPVGPHLTWVRIKSSPKQGYVVNLTYSYDNLEAGQIFLVLNTDARETLILKNKKQKDTRHV
jgi:hypothetical protein